MLWTITSVDRGILTLMTAGIWRAVQSAYCSEAQIRNITELWERHLQGQRRPVRISAVTTVLRLYGQAIRGDFERIENA